MKKSSLYQKTKSRSKQAAGRKPVNAVRQYWRVHFVKYILSVVAFGLFLRLIHIQIFQNEKFEAMANEQYNRISAQKAPRGIIYDRNNVALAMNRPHYSLGVYKRAIKDVRFFSKKIANLTGVGQNKIVHQLNKRSKYVQLTRDLDEETAKIIGALHIPGVQVHRSLERLYPFESKLSQILGFVDVDGKGISGLEMKFDAQLKGHDGWEIVQKDARGRNVMPVKGLTQKSKNGNNIILTIHNVYQGIVEEELAATVAQRNAKGGIAVVTNPATGEILSMASVPTYNANQASKTNPASWRIRAITDIFEPGSTFKIITMMAGLEKDILPPGKKMDCKNGQYSFSGELITDTAKFGELTFTEIFKNSSNIGTAQLAAKIGRRNIFKTARNFGFGNLTGIELPGEVGGIFKNPAEWSNFTIAAISYGYEVAVTGVQMAMAYGAIANGGMLMKPSIIKEIQTPAGESIHKFYPQIIRQVMHPNVAQKMTDILKEVVEDGTGTNAKIAGLSMAGKTGTAQKPLEGKSGYSKVRFIASFAAYYPAEQPQYLVYVSIDEPFPIHSGGVVAAPTVKRIIEKMRNVHTLPRQEAPQQYTQTSQNEMPDRLPELSGRHKDTAMQLLDEHKIAYEFQGSGQMVLEQIIVSGQNKPVEKVILVLGDFETDSKYQEVPDLIGLSLREAIAKLSVRGIQIKIIGNGKVVKQTPVAGEKIKVDASCYLECAPAQSLVSLIN